MVSAARPADHFCSLSTLSELVEALAHPSGQLIVLIAAYFPEPPRYGDHLDRVERGDRPLQRVSASPAGSGGISLPLFRARCSSSSTAFEYLQSSVASGTELGQTAAAPR